MKIILLIATGLAIGELFVKNRFDLSTLELALVALLVIVVCAFGYVLHAMSDWGRWR